MEELLQAVQAALQAEPVRPDGSFTTKEFYDELNKRNLCSIKKARKFLLDLKAAGKIKVLDKVPIKDISDRPTTVRGWIWVKNDEA